MRFAPRCASANATPASTHARAACRVGDEREGGFNHRVGRGDAKRGAGAQRIVGRLGEVEGMRPDQDGTPDRRGLDQVLPAERDEAPTHVGDVGREVVREELAHRVADPHGRGDVDDGARRSVAA